MTHTELKMLRKLFFLQAIEAAEHVAGVTKKTWYRWEEGSRNIPRAVQDTMIMLAATRVDLLSSRVDVLDSAYQYVELFEDYPKTFGLSSVIKWRMAQSVAAQIMSEHYATIKD